MNPALDQGDLWPQEREGYSETITPAYAPAPRLRERPHSSSVRAEERFGSIVAGVGIILIAQTATQNFAGIARLGILPPGPLETCAVGILIWLHAKWRRATTPR